MYNIKIEYITGDSFHTEQLMETIEMEWKHLDRAKECLKRIQNHYEFYKKYDSIYHIPKDAIVPVGVVMSDKTACLELIADDGEPFRYGCFWVGYFETLLSATIVMSFKDIKYEPR